MKSIMINRVDALDLRFPLHNGAGSDAVHTGAQYAFAVTRLHTGGGPVGHGLTLTLGPGNQEVCSVIHSLGGLLTGFEIEDLMAEFGAVSRRLAENPAFRWLGPHKGVVHLALSSIVNACFDLWAKVREVPLWRLLLDLTPEQVVALLDFSYIDDALSPAEALTMMREQAPSRTRREGILAAGYPGYDTSVGWFQYSEEQIRRKVTGAQASGFRAFKLKVGSIDHSRDLHRASLLREVAGADSILMFDANQQWSLSQARHMGEALRPFDPYWIEEPTHPDDVEAHRLLAAGLAPIRIALGEHVPNRVVFKNFIQARAVHFVQADCARLAGVSEFLTVSLLARKYGLPVVPHVGDMGQIHQHLVIFNHVALGHEALFLEHIPHMRDKFVHPACVCGGVYRLPEEPGLSCELKDAAVA